MADQGQASDPYSEFGGSVASAAHSAATGDPYAEFGGKSSPPVGVDEGTISARPGGVKSWLEDLEGDVRYGTGRTAIGRGLRHLGARGIDVGVPESTGELVGGSAIGPVRAAHGILTIPSHPVRGINETVSGAMQGAAMPLAWFAPGTLAAPELLPRASLGAMGAKAGEQVASGLGASPDTAELVGNVTGAAAAASPEIINRVGPPIVRTTGRVLASPMGRHVAGGVVGAAVGEAVGHPFIGSYVGERLGARLGGLGERMRNFGIEGPPNPFRDVPEPGPLDVFNVQEPSKIARPPETPAPYRMRVGEVPRDVIRPRGLLTSGEPQPTSIAAPEEPIRFSLGIPETPAPVRIGPGGVPPDLIGRPNARVLAGNQGIIRTPIGLLREPRLVQESAFMNPEMEIPGSWAELRPGMREGLEDEAIQDAMNADLEQHGAAARLEQGREFAERNSMGVPKWQRTAEAKARAILDEARQNAEERALTRELGRGMVKPVKAKPTIAPPEAKASGSPGVSVGRQAEPSKLPGVKVPSDEESQDLTPLLEESLRRARLKRQK